MDSKRYHESSSSPALSCAPTLLLFGTMKRCPVVESAPESPFQEEERMSSRKTQRTPCAVARDQGGRPWGAWGLCPLLLQGMSPVPPCSEPCLCGCSLKTKVVLHPRPPSAPRPASGALPSLPSGRKPPSPTLVVFKAQLSHSSSKPKAKAASQLLSRGRSSPSCNATCLHNLVLMGVWPERFIDAFSKSLPKESLHISNHNERSLIPSQDAMSSVMSLVEGDKSFLPPLFK
nr:uncharacterized protein LOC105875877 isoform X2 [Microcebus murinus]